MKKSAIVIGAGYGGMALANILGKAGYQVDVYEKTLKLGGALLQLSRMALRSTLDRRGI